MDITCSKCGMEYSLDDTLISGTGTSVRCMNCNQVFKVYKPSGRGPDEWILRQAHGPFRTIDNLSVLQQWIQEGKISRDDLLSQGNGPWKKVGDIEQLKVFFEKAKENPAPAAGRLKQEKSEHLSTVRRKPRVGQIGDNTERIAALPQSPDKNRTLLKPFAVSKPVPQHPGAAAKMVESDKPTLPPPPVVAEPHRFSTAADELITQDFNRSEGRSGAPAAEAAIAETLCAEKRDTSASRETAHTDAPDFSSIPTAKEDVAWGTGAHAAVTEPAWTEKTGGLPRYEEDANGMPMSRRGHGKWIILGAAVVGLGIAAAVLFTPKKGDELLSTMGNMVTSTEQERFQKFFDRGQESFLLDTDASFLQADREFQKVLALKDGHPLTLAALGRLYAVWAQYYRDAKLDVLADSAGAAANTSGEDKEIALLSREFDEKLQEAVQWSRQALAAAPVLKEALLASADVARLSGNMEEAASKLKQAEASGKDAETEYAAVLIEMDKRASPQALADRLEKSVGTSPMIRAIYRNARLRAAAGQKDAAKRQLKKLFALNSAHPQAKALDARMNANKPVLLIEKGASKGSAPAQPNDLIASKTSPAADGEGSAAEAGNAVASGDNAPQGIPALLKKAAALQNGGQPDAAEKLYESVLERQPSNVEALTGVGYCRLDKGETGKAVASFRRALNTNPSYGAALLGTAETYKTMGQKEQSLKYYRSYLLANPTGAQADMARKNVARFEAELGITGDEKPAHAAGNQGDDDIVIDDSPPKKDQPGTLTPEQGEGDTPKNEAKDAPASDKPQIIIFKKDESNPSEE